MIIHLKNVRTETILTNTKDILMDKGSFIMYRQAQNFKKYRKMHYIDSTTQEHKISQLWKTGSSPTL